MMMKGGRLYHGFLVAGRVRMDWFMAMVGVGGVVSAKSLLGSMIRWVSDDGEVGL